MISWSETRDGTSHFFVTVNNFVLLPPLYYRHSLNLSRLLFLFHFIRQYVPPLFLPLSLSPSLTHTHTHTLSLSFPFLLSKTRGYFHRRALRPIRSRAKKLTGDASRVSASERASECRDERNLQPREICAFVSGRAKRSATLPSE